jgi:hypothetical protein
LVLSACGVGQIVYGEIEFRFFVVAVPAKVSGAKNRMSAPSCNVEGQKCSLSG